MGGCLSKKTASSGSLPDLTKLNTESEKKNPEKETIKKEIFIIKHRKSHDTNRQSKDEEKGKLNQKLNSGTTSTASEAFDTGNNGGISNTSNGGGTVSTSSCTKEELDAILIRCGHLSRSSSTGKYSGSKRSYDFDDHDHNFVGDGDDEASEDKIHRHRQRHSRGSSSPSRGRRRTPSRERDNHQHHHSGGGGGGGGRRVSRSPGKRSVSPISNSNSTSRGGGGSTNRPEKMVSVPATVSSLAMEKSNNCDLTDGLSVAAIKRISVKRNVYVGDKEMGSRPRSRSPGKAKVRVLSENQNGNSNQNQQQQPLMVSQSNSRKAEQSPYRRNHHPLREIDQNSLGFEHLNLGSNNILSEAILKPNVETLSKNIIVESIENKTCISNCKPKEQHIIVEDAIGVPPITRDITVTEITSGDQTLNPPKLIRTRSSRRSRDLDINFEPLLNPTPSYNSLLLEDIHNFHQNNNTSFSLPPCVTKACSIVEAVADLNNSSTSSNRSEQFNKNPEKFSFGDNLSGKNNRLEKKDPFAESEVGVYDDLMEPSFHNYVTMRRGKMMGGLDMEEQEPSGSNSFVGGPQNSADSTNRWTSLKSIAREENWDPLGIQMNAFSETGQRKVIVKQQSGIGCGKVDSFRNL